VSQTVVLTVTGSTEIHLSGYFEPNRDEMEDNMMFGGDDEEDEDYEEDEEEDADEAKTHKLNKSLK